MSATLISENRLADLFDRRLNRPKSLQGLGRLNENEVCYAAKRIKNHLRQSGTLARIQITHLGAETLEQLRAALAPYTELNLTGDSDAVVISLNGGIIVGARRKQMRNVIERDGAACAWCSKKLAHDHPQATLDHIVPASEGGANGSYNMVLACKKCNHARGHTSAIEWIEICLDKGLKVQTNLIWDRLLEASPRYERLYGCAA